MPERAKRADSNDPDLKELRDEFTYAESEKQHIREAGAKDMRAINGDGWDPEERRLREDAGRPCIWLDELGQYVNQLINEVRQNKRSIKVAPQGRGATPKSAEIRANLIRQIEYRSNAQQAYAVMFENAAQRGYGYLRIKPEYAGLRSNDQELRIVPIPNPDLVTEDPGAQRTDGSDWKFLWFREEWTHELFKRRFPKAQISDFTEAARQPGVSDWVKATRVMVAERWSISTKQKCLYMVTPPAQPGQPPPPPFFALEDDPEYLKRLPGSQVKELRKVDYPVVKQQIVNGVEILDEMAWKGPSIPFVACYGKILYLEDGGQQKKHIHSLIRLALAAAMKHAYIDTCEVEVIGAVPRNSWLGYKGQFANPHDWQKANHEPVPYLESEFILEGWNPSWGPVPLQQRQPWDPPLQNLEIAKESARRAIQAAIAASPLPTSAQKHNEKSGVALREIKDSGQTGSFHFVDHFDDALMRTGAILDENLEFYYDTLRQVTVRNPDDQPAQVTLNDPNDPESSISGEHDITLSVGPRQASEREAASEFADTFISSPFMKLLQPALALKLVALAIRLKAVGPIGDEMADMLSPKDGDEQQPTVEQVQQAQAQVKDLTAKLQQAAKMLETDQAKQAAQVKIAKMDGQIQIRLQEMKNAAEIRKAEIAASVKGYVEEAAHAAEHEQLALGQAHEAQQAELDRQHEAGLTAMQGAHAAQTADREHQQALEQGAVSHGQALEQGELQAQRAAEQAEAQRAAEAEAAALAAQQGGE